MLALRRFTSRDIPAAMNLVRAAEWNQREADWLRAIDLEPDGCFLAVWDGQPVGTATAAVFGDAAWIALVLVDAAHRKRGIGTALMEHTLAYLDGRGVRSICLTATPLGQPIYERLGFVGEYRLTRYEGIPVAAEPVAEVEAVLPADLAALSELERAATGLDRPRLLARLYAESKEGARLVRREGRVVGFLLTRAGSRAFYLGPCLADATAGPLLLADAFQRHAGQPVFLDVPAEHRAARAFVEAHRLTPQRNLYRMRRGPRLEGSLQGLWTSWGPEKG